MSKCSSCGIREESIWRGNGHCSDCERAYIEEHGESIAQVTGRLTGGCNGGPKTPLGVIFVVVVWIFIAIGIIKLFGFLL